MVPADGRVGATVGKYKLHEIVGRGGMGVVYRAEHVYIGREVAVKILHEGYGGREESIKRFLREARAASLINHPNIVEVTDFGKSTDGTVFFVMELLVGDPLDNILARERRLDLLRSITICNQLAAALAAAHSKGIIHRDLKPENVMLIPREGRRELIRRVSDESGAHETTERETQFDFVKILDFGVAKVREPETQKARVTKQGVVFGTPEYMAPETERIGYSDARSDIYALGVMFYEMLTGTVPFVGETPVEVMMKQVNERVPPMHQVAPDAEITEEAERMILKALAKDADHRHQNMEEFHRDLQKCYGQLRFRRMIKTPTTTSAAIDTPDLSALNTPTPPATTIPLTKKKPKAQPGAVPVAIRPSGVISVELETVADAERPRTMTPKLPGLPLNAAAPILLTKKKVRSTGSTPTTTMPAATAAGRDPDPAATRLTPPAVVLETEAVTPPPRRAELRVATPPAGQGPVNGAAAPASELPKRKRTTLPLGLDQERERPQAATGWGPTAAPAPTAPPLPTHGPHIGGVMISVAPPPRAPISGPIPVPTTADRPTPKIAIDTQESDESDWMDAETAPGVTSGRR
jgi:serine/threonine protein kinase